MLLTISGNEFYQSDDKISAFHYTPERERHVLPCDAFSIWYAAHGSGIFYIDNHEMVINEGEVFMIDPSKEHYFMSLQDPNELCLELYHCRFYPDALYGIPSNCTSIYHIAAALSFHHHLLDSLQASTYLTLNKGSNKVVRDILIRMIHEYTSRPTGYKNMMRAYLNELVTAIFRDYEEILTHKKSGIPENNNPVITIVIKYIQYNLQSDLSLDTICNYFYLSNSYLSKLFKKHTGITIQDYIQNLRIEKACDLLRNTDRTIDGIADRIGYNSNRYFQKLFKDKVGMTMYEYRQRYRTLF